VAVEMLAKFESACGNCGGPIPIGAEITFLPAKGKRRGRAFHRECAVSHGQSMYPTTVDAWRKHREWMSADDFAMVEDAMSRMVKV
jgi:hypothetical protein